LRACTVLTGDLTAVCNASGEEIRKWYADSHRSGPGKIHVQFMWDLYWINWRWGQVFPLGISIISINYYSIASKEIVLEVNIEKTKYMLQGKIMT
jgi:hypothetical protein